MGYKMTLLLLVLFAIGGQAQTPQLPIYTLGNKVWQKDTATEYFLVLKNNKSCARCFEEIDNYLHDSLHKDNIYCVCIVDSSVFARKMADIEARKLFRFLRATLFEYDLAVNESYGGTGNPNSLFHLYNVEITPSLLYIKNNEPHYYSYQDLYGREGYKAKLSAIVKGN